MLRIMFTKKLGQRHWRFSFVGWDVLATRQKQNAWDVRDCAKAGIILWTKIVLKHNQLQNKKLLIALQQEQTKLACVHYNLGHILQVYNLVHLN